MLGNVDDNTTFCWKICYYQSRPLVGKFQCRSDNASIYAILLLTHISYFFTNSSKCYFLIEHHYETQSETFDSAAFVRIL